MENLKRAIFEKLMENMTEIEKAGNEVRSIEKEIRSGKYTVDHVNSSLIPKLNTAKADHQSMCDKAIREARELVEETRKQIAYSDILNPSEITEDAKLLNMGIAITKGDLDGILYRNPGNKTMQILVSRYAKEHGIDGLYRESAEEISREAAFIGNGIIDRISNWIGKENARSNISFMLGEVEE